ncbi:MAG: orotate phosphoribosyltransferase [Defluviitaleaceae bacterium]|nr:orotate phosphoribosyltransferase [Defluviitaleaceae bacterium]
MTRAEEVLTKADALLSGHFLYTSGRHGEQYMQCARVLQFPEYTEELAKIVAEGFAGEKVDIVLAPAIGGIVWGYELSRALGAKSIFAEREEGVMTLRRGFEIPQGARVVVAEDVVTTGGTVVEILKIAKEKGAEIVGVGLILNRSGGKADFGTKIVSALTKEIVSYAPEECPLCKQGLPITKPGSRATISAV